MIKLLKSGIKSNIDHLSRVRKGAILMTEYGRKEGMPFQDPPKGDLYAEKCFRYMFNGNKEKTEKYHKKYNEDYNNLLDKLLFENQGDKTTFIIPKNIANGKEPEIDVGENEATRILGEKIKNLNADYDEYFGIISEIDNKFGYWKLPKRLDEFGRRSSQ